MWSYGDVASDGEEDELEKKKSAGKSAWGARR
jgi:hypothetical protein